MGVESDWGFDTPTGFVPITLSNQSITGLTAGQVIATINNIPKGSTPTVRSSLTTDYTISGSDAAGWQLLCGSIPPTLPSTCKIFAYNQIARFQMTP